jgi:hypothetical protein
MAKKIKECKFVHGTSIMKMQGFDTWITCTLTDDTKVSISLEVLFKLLDQFDLNVVKHGDHFRTISFESNENFGKVDYELSPLKLIEKLS